jgi:phosphatidylinositol glycan class F
MIVATCWRCETWSELAFELPSQFLEHPAHNNQPNMTTQIREPSKLKSLALPVEPLTNDTAKVYTHIHPIILLSLYAYQFPSIVADPVPALTNTLIWTGALQVLYAVICLPPTTGGSASADKKKQGDKKKAARAEGGINGKILVC